MESQKLNDQELLDLVNENDEVVGTELRGKIHDLGLRHREVHVWFFDEDKNVYFQKSGLSRPSAGLLDATAGGHVESGEDYLETAVREAKEELGIDIAQNDLVLINKFSGFSEYKTTTKKNNFIRNIYIHSKPISDFDIKIQGDFDSLGIHKLSFKELDKLDEEGKKKLHKFVPVFELPFVLNYLRSL